MRFGTSLLISLVAVIALVAEVILYFMFGFAAALAGQGVGTVAALFFSLMFLTVALGVMAPVCAGIEVLTKKENVGVFILIPSMLLLGLGLVGFTLLTVPQTTNTTTESSLATLSSESAAPESELDALLAERDLLAYWAVYDFDDAMTRTASYPHQEHRYHILRVMVSQLSRPQR